MSLALAAAAFAMGLAGGPHCTAMCGAACAGVVRAGARPAASAWQFQLGRLLGYSLAGAVAAAAVQGFAALVDYTSALRPAWVLFHAAVLAWGLMLLVFARQPMWMSNAGRAVWTKVRPMAAMRGGVFTAGALWAFMPCGLLYSALLVASLSGGPLDGAFSMALFAAGSGAWLAFAPALVLRLRDAANRARADWGTRICGALLAAGAAFALWVDLSHRIAEWCA